jgi:hypothetical protein
MYGADSVGELWKDLKEAGLGDYAMRREGDSLYLVYDDMVVFERKAEPILNKWGIQYSRRPVFDPEKLKDYGFRPEEMGADKLWQLIPECWVVKLSLD